MAGKISVANNLGSFAFNVGQLFYRRNYGGSHDTWQYGSLGVSNWPLAFATRGIHSLSIENQTIFYEVKK